MKALTIHRSELIPFWHRVLSCNWGSRTSIFPAFLYWRQTREAITRFPGTDIASYAERRLTALGR